MAAMYVCTRPFEKLEIQEGGDVYFCCPDWLPKPLGNLANSELDDIWNSESAREIRRSIFDGSFRHCRESACPFLAAKEHFVRTLDSVESEKVQAAIRSGRETLDFAPATLKCSYDRSCNLTCPSCRVNLLQANLVPGLSENIEKIQSRIYPKLGEIGALEITGSGDPFASAAFLRLLRQIDPAMHPRLNIGLFTNALLWTPARWEQLANIHSLPVYAHISIDAAAAETYALNRRGGSFALLLENLRFIASLRRERKLRALYLNMTVQENNFREIPAFIALGREFGADRIAFSRLSNWGTFSAEEFQKRAVHLPAHPSHRDFLAVMDSPEARAPEVFLGNLSEFASPSFASV